MLSRISWWSFSLLTCCVVGSEVESDEENRPILFPIDSYQSASLKHYISNLNPVTLLSEDLLAQVAMLETFETVSLSDPNSSWVESAHPNFQGTWSVGERSALQVMRNDKGLRLNDRSKHHAICSRFTKPELMSENFGKDIAVSYEVLLEETLKCGGSYLKLLDMSKTEDLSEFSNETEYVVMFGPDRCGGSAGVHLIIKQFNPILKEWIEHHLKEQVRLPADIRVTHAYGFHLTKNNEYEVFIDGESVAKGSMHDGFVPPFTPERTVDDPEDTMPADWVTEQLIIDETVVKPEEWDDQPFIISPEKASVPADWLLDEPVLLVRDENEVQPEDWNEAIHGEWFPETIPNPACVNHSGCGPYVPPKVRNPNFKGPWVAPRIANPAYVGEYKPRQHPNPAYFKSENPHALASFDSVGIELWTLSKDMVFDNIVVGHSQEAVQAVLDLTFVRRHDAEMKVIREMESQEQVESIVDEPIIKASHSAYSEKTIPEMAQNLLREYPNAIFTAVIGIACLVVLKLARMILGGQKQKVTQESKKKVGSPTQVNSSTGTVATSTETDKKTE